MQGVSWCVPRCVPGQGTKIPHVVQHDIYKLILLLMNILVAPTILLLGECYSAPSRAYLPVHRYKFPRSRTAIL